MDSFSRADSRELRVIAGRIQTATLVISKTAHDNPLEDDTVYSRYEICVVTEKTFKNVGLGGTEPLINASPGGYFVRIDGSLIERRRKEFGLSIGRLAEMIGVSRRTLYGCERSMAKASVTSAYNLANVLGIPVAKPVDLFEKTRKQRECLLMKAKRAIARQALLLNVFRKFASCDISPVERAPFDFILNVPDEKCVIVGAIAENSEKSIDDRAEEILSVCQVVNAHPVLISEKSEVCPSKDILCISFDALADIQSPNDLIGSA